MSGGFKIPLPALTTDSLLSTLPLLQAADGDAHFSRKRFCYQTCPLSILTDAAGLSFIKKTIIIIHKICHRNAVEFCQILNGVLRNMLGNTLLDIHVHRTSYHSNLCYLCLRKTSTVSAPPEPVRYVFNFLVPVIPLLEFGSVQNLTWGTQCKTMYQQRCIPHIKPLCLRKNIHAAGKPV